MRSVRLGLFGLVFVAIGMPAATCFAGMNERVMEVAVKSDVRRLDWEAFGSDEAPGNGPVGYTRGMALAYARAYRDLRSAKASAYVLEMARPVRSTRPFDALFLFRKDFAKRGMFVERGGVDTLRGLFVLLFELGLRESDGRYYLGVDTGPNKPKAELAHMTAETSEAGLFQSSWNFAEENRLLQSLFKDYEKGRRPCFSKTFREGLKPVPFENIGDGAGARFQQLAKECPGFAVEFAALSVRDDGRNYHFINRHRLEIRREVADFLMEIEKVVDEGR